MACLRFLSVLGKVETKSKAIEQSQAFYYFSCNELAAKYESDHDDYNVIMTKAIADRMAEAFAEALHEFVRTELWGYCSQEGLSPSDLHRIKYQVR